MKYDRTYKHQVTIRRVSGVLGTIARRSFTRLGPGVLCVRGEDLDDIRRTGSCAEAVVRYVPLAKTMGLLGEASQGFVQWLMEQYDPNSGFVVAVIDGSAVADLFMVNLP